MRLTGTGVTLGLGAAVILWDVLWSLAGVRQVTPRRLKRLLGDPRTRPFLADTRTALEYRLFHIPGAESLPRLFLDPSTLPPIPRDTPILVICMTGHRSPIAAWRLRKRGYRNVANLTWGMLGWLIARGDTERSRT